MTATTKITISASVQAPVSQVWKLWNTPEHVMKWNNASDDWHTPSGSNDLREGGRFNYKMAAKDGSFSFDFWGDYDKIETNRLIEYTLGDGRKVKITFTSNGNSTDIEEVFEAETQNSVEMQKSGWQSILDNFKKYAEQAGN